MGGTDSAATAAAWHCTGDADAGIVRFAAGIVLSDFHVSPSLDGQCLLIHCRRKLVAWCSAIGGSAEIFELTCGRYTLAEFLERIPASNTAA